MQLPAFVLFLFQMLSIIVNDKPTAIAPFSASLNFRMTCAYLTDGAGETCVIDTDQYTGSVIRNGLTFGWDAAGGGTGDLYGRNRATSPPEFGGMVFVNAGTTRNFRLNLPGPGIYKMRLALGDWDNAQPGLKAIIKDNSTTLATIPASGYAATSSGQYFLDATGTEYSYVAWPGSNTQITQTFSSSVLIISLPGNMGGDPNCIAHFEVTNQ